MLRKLSYVRKGTRLEATNRPSRLVRAIHARPDANAFSVYMPTLRRVIPEMLVKKHSISTRCRPQSVSVGCSRHINPDARDADSHALEGDS